MSRKPKLTSEEKQFILDNHTMPVMEIARHIGRDYRSVQRILNQSYLVKPETVAAPTSDIFLADNSVILELQKSPEWKQLSLEFNADELQMFANSYANYLQQFTKQQDVLATERTQIMLVVKLEILMHRILKERQDSQADASKTKVVLDTLYSKVRAGNATKEDHATIRTLEEKLVALDMAKKSFAVEYNHNMEKHKDIMRELKATRDQRLKSIENSKVSFIDLLKSLQDDDFRQKEGRYAELMKKASEEALKKLGAGHRFMDGKIARPVTCAETVDEENIDELSNKS